MTSERTVKIKWVFPMPKTFVCHNHKRQPNPAPDYVQYQDQAMELDQLTGRIGNLVKALRVAGVYDASAPALQRLLSEDTENVLIPVEQWAVFGEKGGLKGVMDFLPIKEIGETLIGLYEARDRTKQELYEVTGISDIIRGATNPNETLGAQELKGKYAGLRMGAMQGMLHDLPVILSGCLQRLLQNNLVLRQSGKYLASICSLSKKKQWSFKRVRWGSR